MITVTNHKIDNRNKPYKLASDVAELIKTLRVTPNATTKITPFEAHFGRKPNTPLSISKIVKFVMGKHQTCLFRPKASNQTSTNGRSNVEQRCKR